MRIFLSGPMGAGKTTVARELASIVALRLVDLDESIEAHARASIADIVATRGEPELRRLEREQARRVAQDDDVVVALGGGTVADRDVRRWLLSRGTLVTLDAPLEVLASRVGDGRGRPLLGDDPRRALESLCEQRSEAYAECHARIENDGTTPRDVAVRVLEVALRAPIAVPLGLRSYVIEVGEGARRRAAKCAHDASADGLVVLVSDDGASRWAEEVESSLSAARRRVTSVRLARGEEHKRLPAVERVWDAALAASADRDALVLAVGGGVVGDVAGFAASTLLRGVAFAQLPTTLLAMVDSSIGGKTGIYHARGKNLVGTFHQPRFVLCDPDVLATLDPMERRSGLAEVVKAAWIEGEHDVAALEADATALVAGDVAATERAVRRALATKARIVCEDEREQGVRRQLNLGHTVAHALEAAAGYGNLRHGDAVALGLVAASRVGRALGRARAEDRARLEALLGALGLPLDLDRRLSAELIAWISQDKKRARGAVQFVVPGAPGRVDVVPVAVEQLVALVVQGGS